LSKIGDVKHYESMPQFRKALGNALRNKRKALRLSQEELAERLDLHRNYVSLVERGLQNITIETLFKMSGVLGCSPSGLLAEAERTATSSTPPAETLQYEPYPLPPSPAWHVAEKQP
jgi:transcriptional regulator with XRE-family HTH domain